VRGDLESFRPGKLVPQTTKERALEQRPGSKSAPDDDAVRNRAPRLPVDLEED
jgi:hypothetical protein